MKNGFFTDMEVHPAAAVFPMLSDDELRDLAEDIKANGLIHPIILDGDGVLIDGRNRLAACNLAGVVPTFENLNGHDPVAYILASNISRRHMNAGQRAMAVVMVRDFHKVKIVDAAKSADVAVGRVGQAETIRKWAPDLAEAVLSGAEPLNSAYDEARRRKAAATSTEAQMQRLRTKASDLAELVVEESLSLSEAMAVADTREKEEHEARVRMTRYFIESSEMLRSILWKSPGEILDGWMEGVSPNQQEGVFAEQIWSAGGLRALANDLAALADEMASRQG